MTMPCLFLLRFSIDLATYGACCSACLHDVDKAIHPLEPLVSLHLCFCLTRRRSSSACKSFLAYQPEASENHDQELDAQDHRECDHRADHPGHPSDMLVLDEDPVTVLLLFACPSTPGPHTPGRVAAGVAPVFLAANSKLIHASNKLAPRQRTLVCIKEGILSWLRNIACGAVVEEKAHAGFILARPGPRRHGGTGHEFPGKCGCVIRHTVEVLVDGDEIGEAEE
jgi:hypothetical protein